MMEKWVTLFCVKFWIQQMAFNFYYITIWTSNDTGFSVLTFAWNDLQSGIKVMVRVKKFKTYKNYDNI